MSMFFNEIAEINAAHLESQGINADVYKRPQSLRPFVSNEHDEDELHALTEERRDDLLSECENFNLAQIICSENDLEQTDLLPRLIVAIQLWNNKPETAHESLKAASRLVYLAMDQVAQKAARKELDL